MQFRISKESILMCNTLSKQTRYFGYKLDWHDGPIPCFGFWFFHFYIWYDYR